MQADTATYGLSTLHNEMERQKERMLAFEQKTRSNISEAYGEIIHTKRLQEEINEAKLQANTDLGLLRGSIGAEDAFHRDLRDEMGKFKVVLGSLQEELAEKTLALELCATENNLVLRTLQIDITPVSISVPIPTKSASAQPKTAQPNAPP
jgi:hypothetical protein